MKDNLKKSFDHLLDVYEIEKESVDVYSKRFSKIGKFINTELRPTLESKGEN